MQHRRFPGLLLLLLTVMLTSCNMEGTSGLSHSNQAVLITGEHLYTWNLTSGAYEQIEPDRILGGFGASVNQDDDVLYAKLVGSTIQICVFRASTRQSSCPVTLGQGNVASGGLLSYLADGNLVVVYDERMRVYTSEGVEVSLASNVGLFVTVPYIYKVKRETGDSEWYMKPYAKSGCSQDQAPFWLVVQDNNRVYRYSAANISSPTLLPREITNDMRAVIEHRGVGITTAALSPDGTQLVIRTNSGQLTKPAPYDLYVLDLQTKTGGLVQLVEGADFPIHYAFSPCGDQLAYESNIDGRSVWILDFASGFKAKLADGASLPQWYAE